MFQLVATILLAFVFMIWSKEGMHNIAIKATFGGAMLWGVFSTAVAFGYLVKM